MMRLDSKMTTKDSIINASNIVFSFVVLSFNFVNTKKFKKVLV